MEKRILNMMINKVGNKTGSVNHKLSIPNAWAKAMGITKEDREVEVTLRKNNTIVIRKVEKDKNKEPQLDK